MDGNLLVNLRLAFPWTNFNTFHFSASLSLGGFIGPVISGNIAQRYVFFCSNINLFLDDSNQLLDTDGGASSGSLPD